MGQGVRHWRERTQEASVDMRSIGRDCAKRLMAVMRGLTGQATKGSVVLAGAVDGKGKCPRQPKTDAGGNAMPYRVRS